MPTPIDPEPEAEPEPEPEPKAKKTTGPYPTRLYGPAGLLTSGLDALAECVQQEMAGLLAYVHPSNSSTALAVEVAVAEAWHHRDQIRGTLGEYPGTQPKIKRPIRLSKASLECLAKLEEYFRTQWGWRHRTQNHAAVLAVYFAIWRRSQRPGQAGLLKAMCKTPKPRHAITRDKPQE